ncbi:SEN1 N terminal-domain-containing protein [Lasiosphaeria hispida]|uniref:SEN1 N terminal-domain-containing protein n=1 Tax=Lasiosphaeria hispida TaxID=260671 RepID=A0AAJ0HV82_9PEZI|nr:SEN1 N terminal-domain-containing protein [Lasiosphaeria hispida]
MMQSAVLYERLMELYQDFKGFPTGAHLFCPKIADDDITNYDDVQNPDENGASSEEKLQRTDDYDKRCVCAYRLSLLLAIDAEDASTWLDEWTAAVTACLSRCDTCAKTWHKSRDKFLKDLESDLGGGPVEFLERKLNEFDKQRIDKGLETAKTLLEKYGPINTAKLADHDVSAVLALFEALCCMPYLAQPENREVFNYVFETVQQKKPLRMQCGIIPTMTYFLFDENPFRRKFAQAAWQRVPPDSLTQDEWDWSVGDQLKATILSTSLARGAPTGERIHRFWQGFQCMLPAMNEQRILESLRGMEVSPSIYFLALEHLGTDSPDALAEVLKGLRGLMEKSPKEFWAAYDQVTPSQMAEEIFKSPAFRPFLNQSLIPNRMEIEENTKVPALAAWIRALIRSLPANRRSDACETLLRHLFETFRTDPNATPESRATSTLSGLVALGESLDGYLHIVPSFDTGTSLIIVNQLLNRVVQYRDVIISAAQLKDGDKYNVGLSKAAMSITHSALALDAKATSIEWNALIDEKPVQEAVNRDSGALWESFLEMLWSGRVELAKAMLLATMPLRNIEKFIPKRKEPLNIKLQKFNSRYQQQTTAIGRMLGRISDFNPSDLDLFCSEPQSKTIHPIVSSLIHGEEAIRESGFELVKAITSEILPSDAVNKMLEEYFTPFLSAFSGAVINIMAEREASSPWSHMIPLLKCSEFVLDGLCDPSVGQLRSRTLTPEERTIIKHWWESQWRLIGHSLRMMRFWHAKVDKKIMEDFCRDVMELADKFLAQDGLMASALSHETSSGILQSGSMDTTTEAMRIVLESPSKFSSFHLVDMLQLRDLYLIQGIIAIIKKLLGRLKDNDMVLPKNTLAHLYNMVKKKPMPGGKLDYISKTNLTNEQRIELLKALGEDAEIEEQFIGVKPAEREAREKERAMRQSKLDFSKAISASLSASVKGHLDSLTPHSDSRKSSLLESLRSEIVKPKSVIKPSPQSILANQLSIKERRAKEKADKAKRDAEAIARAKALRAPAKTVAGEGSGLQGIAGVRGKDHAPALKDEIMVGSSSEDEDDSDDDEIIKRRAGAGVKNMSEAEARRQQILAEKMRGPVKKVKLQRSAKDMRARLIPPMDILHQAILEWDIFHNGNDPPNGFKCAEVSDSYRDPSSYKQTFFPLLINEAWRSFVTSKDETTSKPFGIKVTSRMTVDKFMEVTASVPSPIRQDRGLSEGDIVILSKGEDPLNQPGEIHCLARIWKTTFKGGMVEIVYRLSAKGNGILSVLLPGSEFTVVKITSMTTIEREYAALESLQYYDLMDEVLKAEPSPMLTFGNEAIDGVMKNYQLNTGQAKAILNAKENDGFTLVQGPPGTGKTKTIVAMVGCLLTGVLKAPTAAVPVVRPGMPTQQPQGTSKKLLICAPSNAAVDELVLRLKNGVKTMNGTFHKINVVRLGRTDAVSASVKDVTLDELVKARMDGEANKNTVSDREKLYSEANELKQKVAELRPQLEAARASEDRNFAMKIQREFDDLKRRQAQIGAKIDSEKANGNTFAREADIKRRQIQQDILDKAQVLCATLSGSGHEMFKNLNVEFETVIIDEAAQCVELGALIPLKYGCSKCILVGDPKQLPPTVLSQSAARYGYDQSLFVRMQKNHAKDVHLLDMQYRMHPEISTFPSKEFYEGLLQDGADMAGLRHQPWHRSPLLGPYRFFDVKGSQERGPKNQSLVNEEELKVAMKLYERFRTDYSGIDAKGKIGIITPYKAQLYRLRQRFSDRYGDAITEEIEFNTTDAFQGRECEIIIFSCVRASPTGGIGFMTDIRRMNVGLTRAKSSLWILGDSRALVQGEFWAKLIEDARRRDRYTTGNILAQLSRPGVQLSAAAFAAMAQSAPRPPMPSAPREIIDLVDVEMEDAPPAPPPSNRPQPPQQSQQQQQQNMPPRPPSDNRRHSSSGQSQYGSMPRFDPAPAAPLPRRPESIAPPTLPYRGPSIGGLNERGETVALAPRGAGAPVIQTGTPKKRPFESGGTEQSSKKQHPDPALSRGQQRGPKVRPPTRPSTDPSAMQVLGLAPPARQSPQPALPLPPPMRPQGLPPRPPGGVGGPQRGPPLPLPKKKQSADPFIRRKPNKR